MTTRILFGAEGDSEEVVGARLMRRVFQEPAIDYKQYPSRGFPVVRRSAPTLARAAYYSHYDILVVQFDLDDSLAPDKDGGIVLSRSPRWRDMSNFIHGTLNTCPAVGRERAVRVALMAGCQSTDAWLVWGLNNGKGSNWEAKDRRELKEKLYGDPPRGIIVKASHYVEILVGRMDKTDTGDWPCSLLAFMKDLEAAATGIGAVCQGQISKWLPPP